MKTEFSMDYYWRRQPQQLLQVLGSRAARTEPFVRLYREVRPDKLYLVGSGTSLNAENAAAPLMEQLLQIEVQPVISSRLPVLRAKKPMVVFLSQGGSSTNTLEAMEQLSAYPCVCITGEAECEIGRRAAHHMLIGCDEELVGPKTVGYTSSVLCFYTCALEAARAVGSVTQEEYDRVVSLLERAARVMEENLTRTQAWFDCNAQDLKEAQKYVLVGTGISALAGDEGALKLMETVKTPAMGFEFEEYLHGPIIQTDEKLCGLFYISGNAACRERMAELARCHAQFSRLAYPITGDCEIAGHNPKALVLCVSGEACTEPFEYVLAPQLIAARLPALLGLSEGSEAYEAYTRRCPTKFENGR